MKFRFKPIPESAQIKKLETICAAEGITHAEGALETLIEVSRGDLRKSVNLLQSASTLFEKNLEVESILEIAGVNGGGGERSVSHLLLLIDRPFDFRASRRNW